MSMEKLTDIVRIFCIHLLKLVYLNMLWFLFTIFGIILFGIIPATLAVCKVQHHLLTEKHVPSIGRLFWETYRSHFFKVNQLAIVLGSIGFIIYFDIQFFMDQEGLWSYVVSVCFYIISVWFMITLLYIFPTYLHYQLSLFGYIKYSFIVGMLNPIKTIGFSIAIVGVVYLSLAFPQLLFSIGISLTLFIVMIIGNHAIDNIHVLKESFSN
ncbi:DUF624 domain-containing protein [Gracilibacillus salitolerans]|uniref:DUF624 domain-containing protein n=1 Tax=Gracilibacillus salitolerans TaxID=2663022 RepID=A0A5Q2THE8_9BACI|nr:DUF624 domain-containing protein [Gracilibacillus salitolerans]QGH32818.1 DUF624 domain-containing protein [Gracilibacillus salitolerans]